jgi:BirA family transcriptional regulator, biotin operon repressor / biotin---[acetyl-CoA-carboxylase] ligase
LAGGGLAGCRHCACRRGVDLTEPVIELIADTGSTNSDLLARIAAGETVAEGRWLRAERQSGGRGRMGRHWESPKGNLYCSTVVHLHADDPPAHSLSFVTGLAVHDMLATQMMVSRDQRWLKWPNDIVWDGAKMAGMLLERSGDSVVVGIGVNVAFAPEITGRATTCIHTANGRNANSAGRILDFLAPFFAERLARWRARGLADTLDEWLDRAHTIGTVMSVHGDATTKVSGTFAGLAPDGALRLAMADGSVHVIHAGDVLLGER